MHLLDVNLLYALFMCGHEHHAAAKRWWQKKDDRPWATCEITTSGFIRLCSNAAITGGTSSPVEAYHLLVDNTSVPTHTFLTSPPSASASLEAILTRCQGYRQVTDAILLCLAIDNNAQLATFDQRLQHIAPDPQSVTVVPVL